MSCTAIAPIAGATAALGAEQNHQQFAHLTAAAAAVFLWLASACVAAQVKDLAPSICGKQSAAVKVDHFRQGFERRALDRPIDECVGRIQVENAAQQTFPDKSRIVARYHHCRIAAALCDQPCAAEIKQFAQFAGEVFQPRSFRPQARESDLRQLDPGKHPSDVATGEVRSTACNEGE